MVERLALANPLTLLLEKDRIDFTRADMLRASFNARGVVLERREVPPAR